jgi:hypothetical protein
MPWLEKLIADLVSAGADELDAKPLTTNRCARRFGGR